MMDIKTIKHRSHQIWSHYRLHKAYLAGESSFPITFSCKLPSHQHLALQYKNIKQNIKTLLKHSKSKETPSYHIIFNEINHKILGRQTLPKYVHFETENDFLSFIGKLTEFKKFKTCAQSIITRRPELATFFKDNPACIMQYYANWTQLLDICDYFISNPMPNVYIRQLNIPGVDTKFIEKHKKLLHNLFAILLPDTAIHHQYTKITGHGFEQRYGLRYDESLIRCRLLDPNIFPAQLPDDISMPLSHFSSLEPNCQRVIFTENKINGLCFPSLQKSMVVFGLGYGIRALKAISWLQEKEIYYWGDIDTHGFAMLSQVRQYYPNTISILMNEQTLFKHKQFWGSEPSDKRCLNNLTHLTEEENQLYHHLLSNSYGEYLRLEQERIEFKSISEWCKSLQKEV